MSGLDDLYREVILDHYRSPRNQGELATPPGETYPGMILVGDAEIEALEAAGEAARGSDVYVTLEPCNHHGKTPPCVDALISAGVRRVVFGLELAQ